MDSKKDSVNDTSKRWRFGFQIQSIVLYTVINSILTTVLSSWDIEMTQNDF